ncbi:hypothetical protein H9X96_10660 [Pedobacter sp. N36a]|uniref:DUF7033 domain-containing protein n=1 Tax=Pedobacter sp. N36a TaxID=2767996 RepID=UPI001657000D|nr:hypothetical protein [Pedobacter sp. N36a]MBC8986235.1 hypothetical protein [Pedobacter sp. N36a]
MKLQVYAPLISPRIKYIFNFMFAGILGLELEYPKNLAEFTQAEDPKLCYGKHPISNSLFFKSSGLLTDRSIRRQKIKTTVFGAHQVPFAVEGSTLPFDPFAAAFYFLSRYEEYLPFEDRKEQGYRARLSLQYKLGLLEIPVIDEWAIILKNILHQHFPSLKFPKRDFSFKVAYSLNPEHQSLAKPMRRAFNFMNQMITAQFGGKRKEEQMSRIRQLIERMEKDGHAAPPEFLLPNTQLHTNWQEKLNLPKSYIQLSAKHIACDYSMYYPDTPGFRAGTCSPFYWYDLQIEKQSQLKIFPFAVSYAGIVTGKKTNKDPLLLLNELMDHVKFVDGSFYSLWQHKVIALA